MIELHYAGQVYPLEHDYTVSDVFETMTTLAAEQQGQTWFRLEDGRVVYVPVPANAPFAVVAPIDKPVS